MGARAIVVLVPPGGDGTAVLRLSRLRPAVPIIALAPTAAVARRLVLAWGVHPVVFPAGPQVPVSLLPTLEVPPREGPRTGAAGDSVVGSAADPGPCSRLCSRRQGRLGTAQRSA